MKIILDNTIWWLYSQITHEDNAMSAHQPLTTEVQIPYHVYMGLKKYVASVTQAELDNYIEWCEDMAYLGGCPYIYYHLGPMKLSAVYGYLYTTKCAAELLYKFSK